MPSLLDHLRTRSQVDCDTLDATVAAELGPFVDCTSNQAIAYLELCHIRHDDLIRKAQELAGSLLNDHSDVSQQALAVDIAMILLALPILPNITGCMHIQVNPAYSYSTSAIVTNAHRIHSLFEYILADSSSPTFPPSRICIKIPATWEGLQACKKLEEKGIKTLATTLFSLEQAALASWYDCTYIAPYVNELKVHFEQGCTDPSPNFDVVTRSQRMYNQTGFPTMTLPASLTSVEECMRLAGASHITIAPVLLRELASTGYSEDDPRWASDLDKEEKDEDFYTVKSVNEEAVFRMALSRRDSGKQEVKLISAINIFCDFQEKLEAMMKK